MKDYKKYYLIPALTEEVYLALTTEVTLELWTGEKADFEAVPGSEFSLWDNSITGINIEFEENRMIVQEWYFGEREEKSIVTIILHPDRKGTSVELRHNNIPEEDYANIIDGWDNVYFASLVDFYAE